LRLKPTGDTRAQLVAAGRPTAELEAGAYQFRKRRLLAAVLEAFARQILACAHGLFERAEACAAVLSWAGFEEAKAVDWNARREASLERLANCVEENLRLDSILDCLRRKQ
jgi:adenosylcobyric acid synthase